MNDDLALEIKRQISNYIKEYQQKTETKWKEPLIAFADAKDNLFKELKTAVSPTHNLPTDFLEDAKSVICYFLPFKEEIAKSNQEGVYASSMWAKAYIQTNKLIIDLNNYISEQLKKLGFKSVILPPTHNFDEKRLISDWSHKHVAFIAGLGKFGLHNLLITDAGCCGRLGSIITDAPLTPTPRPKTEFCLYKYNKSCTACVKNCKFDALFIERYDRQKCYSICLKNADFHKNIGFADVCGKCCCITPCSLKNPVKNLQ